MVEEVQAIVVGTGCSICRAVLCDQALVIEEHKPFLIDERMLRMVKAGEWKLLRGVLEEALSRWVKAEERYRGMNAEASRDKDILPFMVTSEGEYIAKEVYDKLDKMREGE